MDQVMEDETAKETKKTIQGSMKPKFKEFKNGTTIIIYNDD
jgi:hypothetical protein